MSFAMPNEALKDIFEILKGWGYLDADVWHEMRENGYPLWTALPGFSTHMVEGLLAPSLDWEKLWGVLNK